MACILYVTFGASVLCRSSRRGSCRRCHRCKRVVCEAGKVYVLAIFRERYGDGRSPLTNYVTPTDHTPNYPNNRARSDRLVGLAGDQRGGVRVRHGLVLLLIREGVVQDLEDAVGGRKLQANDS